jgi:flavodoxin
MSFEPRIIGLIVYSHTGNTLSVAERLQQELLGRGHRCDLFRLQIEGDSKPGLKHYEFSSLPDLTVYDSLIFASPVHGFSLATPMDSYFRGLVTLQGKLVSLFVTHHFPFAWLGGNRALSQMRTHIVTRGGIVGEAGVINWSNRKREQEILQLVEQIGGQYASLKQ